MKTLILFCTFATFLSPLCVGAQENLRPQNSIDTSSLEGQSLVEYKFIINEMASTLYNIEYSGLDATTKRLARVCNKYNETPSRHQYPDWAKNSFGSFCEYSTNMGQVFNTEKPDKSVNYCKPLGAIKSNIEKGRNSALWKADWSAHEWLIESTNRALNYKKTIEYGNGWWGPKSLTYKCN
jgi:hypothetical protein